ncbi:hypothetical protein DPMN_159249 [Dreissena polymorpha]|uniref:Uncharacterized protein n=1 Tax=Dreissena polymorpha TaxID=45954 RepID=A0A9D4EJE4_DREPO|nr:hypothetical protein DPMN_159249 [Dreissena polymorpha]
MCVDVKDPGLTQLIQSLSYGGRFTVNRLNCDWRMMSALFRTISMQQRYLDSVERDSLSARTVDTEFNKLSPSRELWSAVLSVQ